MVVHDGCMGLLAQSKDSASNAENEEPYRTIPE